MKNADEFYKPVVKQNVLIDGIAAETIAKGSKGNIMRKGFMNSLQPNFSSPANNLISFFYPSYLIDSINSLLILIKNDNTAKIYSNFPLSMSTRAKIDVNKGTFIKKEDIFDIEKLEFQDAIYEIKIEPNDKIIFIFRIDWKFGLYFDFTRKLNLENLKEELGYCYKHLFYYDLYAFVENATYFNDFIGDGWFPFIRIIGDDFDKVMQYYKEGKKHNFQIDELLSKFTKAKIESFTQYWW